MADIARGRVSMTPVVALAADADGDSVNVIHHDIGGAVGGNLEYEKADENDKWYYSASTNVTTDAKLISGSFTDGSGSVADADIIKFILVKHLGVDSNGDAATANVHLSLDGTDPKTKSDALVIAQNEAVIFKTYTTPVSNLRACTSNDNEVCVKVVAILDDVA